MSSNKHVHFKDEVEVIIISNEEEDRLAREDLYWKKKCEFRVFCNIMNMRLGPILDNKRKKYVFEISVL